MDKKLMKKMGTIICIFISTFLLVGCVSEKQMEEWAEDLYDQMNEDELESELTPSDISDETKGMAEAIISKIITPEMSELEKVITVHDWLTCNLDYDHSHTNYHAKEALITSLAECQGYAECFELMVEITGVEATIVRGIGLDAKGNNVPHSWNQVKIDGSWYNVDVTKDDPSSSKKKNPEDHSKNNYEYFLLSDIDFEKTHAVKEYYEGEKTCTSTYDRNVIFDFGAKSGVYGDVAFIKDVEDLNLSVKKAMDENKDTLTVWLYDLSALNENASSYISELVKEVKYYVSPSDTFSCSADDLLKFEISFYTGEEWNAIPVVKDVTEFKDLLDEMGKQGANSYVVRYEVEEGEPVISAAQYPCKIKYAKYNSGKYWLVTVTIN